MFKYQLVHQEYECVICFVHRINRRKFKGAVDWAAHHAPYIALWNARIRHDYLHSARHRSTPWMEYLRWLQQQSRMFLRSAYTEDDIAQLPDSDGDNEVVDEYNEMTRHGTIQLERWPFQNYMVSIFLCIHCIQTLKLKLIRVTTVVQSMQLGRWANEASEVLSHPSNSAESHSALRSFAEVRIVSIS
jgi:hypothetical protein